MSITNRSADGQPGRICNFLAAASVFLALMSGMAPGSQLPPVHAQESDENNSYSDPLAFYRIDTDAQNLPIAIDYRGEGESRVVSGRMLLAGSEQLYVRSATAATIFKASRFWQSNMRQLTLQVQDYSFRVTAGSRLVVDDRTETLLPTPVLAIDGDLWLPITFLEQIVGPAIRQTVLWDQQQRRLAIGSIEYNITQMRVERLARATAVHIFCTRPLSYRTDSSEQGFIQLKIYNGEINSGAINLAGRRGLVESIRSRQYHDHAMVYIRTDELVGRFRTYTRQDGQEIVLVLEEEQISALPEPVPRGRANVMVDEGPVDVTRTIDVQMVVIDPGHGGSDVGTVGEGNTLEKHVNLEVAKKLKKYLERKGLDVVLTRDDDSQVDLVERAEIANRASGDLFISLHCNGWFNEGASGIETYFLAPAKSDWGKSVEAAENQSSVQPDDVEFIVWELVQNKFISGSSDLAEVIQHTASSKLGITNRGVRQAGFRVLVGAYMPAVLVEMGFLSNPAEERKLRRGSYQQQLAEALGEAVVEFRDRYAHTAADEDTDSGGDSPNDLERNSVGGGR